MAEMTRDEAYEEALRRIEGAIGGEVNLSKLPIDDLNPLIGALKQVKGLWSLDFTGTNVTDLSPLIELPELQNLALMHTPVQNLSAIAGLQSLQSLDIDRTEIRDLTQLKDLFELQYLYTSSTNVSSIQALQSCQKLAGLFISDSNVSDLSPIMDLENLEQLAVRSTQVADLRPVLSLPKSRTDTTPGIYYLDFKNTPATENDPTLADLSQIENNGERIEETLAYLKTLPPWPEPLPWERKIAEETAPEQDSATPLAWTESGMDLQTETLGPDDDPVRQILLEDLRANVGKLKQMCGNLNEAVYDEASPLLDYLDVPLEQLEALRVHLRIEALQDLLDEPAPDTGDDTKAAEAHRDLKRLLRTVVRTGPGLTLDSPDVQRYLDRVKRNRLDGVEAAEQDAQRRVAKATANSGFVASDLKHVLDAASNETPSQATAARPTLLKNTTVLASLSFIAGGYVSGMTNHLGAETVKSLTAYLATNSDDLLLLAGQWGEAFKVWITPILQRAREMHEATKHTLRK